MAERGGRRTFVPSAEAKVRGLAEIQGSGGHGTRRDRANRSRSGIYDTLLRNDPHSLMSLVLLLLRRLLLLLLLFWSRPGSGSVSRKVWECKCNKGSGGSVPLPSVWPCGWEDASAAVFPLAFLGQWVLRGRLLLVCQWAAPVCQWPGWAVVVD